MTPSRQGRPRRPVPREQKSPLPLILGIGGGVFLLIVIIAVAASGGSERKVAPRPAVAAPPPKVERSVSAQDTGALVFVCSNSPKHPDREVSVSKCPGCGGLNKFYWDYAASVFKCYTCSGVADHASLKCPDCGKAPERAPHIKHK